MSNLGMDHEMGDIGELVAAFDGAEVEENIDLEKLSDGLADLIYVTVGTALEFGIPLDRVWAEVQRANMQKASGPRRADGKVLKPPGWVPPDIHGALWPRGEEQDRASGESGQVKAR